MRRGLTAVAGTIAGTALLIVAKLGPSTADPALDIAAQAPGAEAAQAADAGSAPGGAAGPSASARPGATAKTSASAKPSGSKTPAPASSPPRTGGLRDGTFAGPSVSEKYGTIKVTIVVSSGRISDVRASCSCSGRSLTISQSAFTTLEPRVLSAQSANVQSVSGATYTSTAYKQSLAAAINSAKA